jgi:hypothetical protein
MPRDALGVGTTRGTAGLWHQWKNIAVTPPNVCLSQRSLRMQMTGAASCRWRKPGGSLPRDSNAWPKLKPKDKAVAGRYVMFGLRISILQLGQ